MTTTDRAGADTATFEAEMARLDRLEVADEDTVERVARALFAAAHPSEDWLTGYPEDMRNYFRRLATAAIVALKPAPGTDTGCDCRGMDEWPGCTHGQP